MPRSFFPGSIKFDYLTAFVFPPGVQTGVRMKLRKIHAWIDFPPGTLKCYNQLLNLVLDEAVEFLRDQDDPLKTSDQMTPLGLIVCRGTAVMLVAPTDGTDEIANPFVQTDAASLN
ncbi:sm-like protein LSM7 [Cryptomeria japonica]|uniref:sm-like protein LSM7 n=1 Tax=Cryptomeria japonica TaxID=3369 RepID=UPI0027D9D0AA|nr:sm-like protein LSM7 [Cryptomeria japonica]